MSKILVKFIFLIFIFQIINAETKDELFGDKSIIRKLRNELGSFETEIKLRGFFGTHHFVNEQYDFKLKSGTVNLPEIYGFTKWSYKDEFNSYYSIYLGQCKTEINDDIIKNYLRKWTHFPTIQVPSKFKMLGPSHLLFSLIDNYDQNKENINCKSLKNDEIRCDIIFGEEYKLEYYFKNKDNLKMYPIRIDYLVFEASRFTFRKRFEITKFNYSFNGDYQSKFEYPIGLNCQILKNNRKIQTDLGEKFELEYDAELEYLDLETEDKDVFLKTQFKSQKWSMDNNFSFSVLDAKKGTINKEWINQLHNITLFPDFFFVNDKNSVWYLDDYKLNGKIYRVFEKEQNNAPEREGIGYTHPRNPTHNIVSHYYSESDNKVPEFIEIRTRGFRRNRILATLKIKVKKHTLLS